MKKYSFNIITFSFWLLFGLVSFAGAETAREAKLKSFEPDAETTFKVELPEDDFDFDKNDRRAAQIFINNPHIDKVHFFNLNKENTYRCTDRHREYHTKTIRQQAVKNIIGYGLLGGLAGFIEGFIFGGFVTLPPAMALSIPLLAIIEQLTIEKQAKALGLSISKKEAFIQSYKNLFKDKKTTIRTLKRAAIFIGALTLLGAGAGATLIAIIQGIIVCKVYGHKSVAALF